MLFFSLRLVALIYMSQKVCSNIIPPKTEPSCSSKTNNHCITTTLTSTSVTARICSCCIKQKNISDYNLFHLFGNCKWNHSKVHIIIYLIILFTFDFYFSIILAGLFWNLKQYFALPKPLSSFRVK